MITLKQSRGTTNSNARGGAPARRARKRWLLTTFGDGTRAKCALALPGCLVWVTFETLSVDRFPVPGYLGGRYVRGNIRPACGHCNSVDGGHIGAAQRRENRS